MRILRLGDPHVTVSNLEESEKLMQFVVDTAFSKEIERVEILGDLFDTHAVVRAEVLAFWSKWFGVLCGLHGDLSVETIVLVGNHDQKGSRESESSIHALVPFRDFHDNLKIIENPSLIPCRNGNRIAYIPHISGADNFLQAARIIKACDINNRVTHVVCHQTFLGATYENGIFAEDGIDINQVPFDHIISGHIHKSQKVGKCFYPGTARYLKSTDADQKKGFWIFEDHNPIEFISTENVVTPMYTIVIKEGEEMPEVSPRAKIVVELHGSSQWISKFKKQLKNKASIRSFPSDRKASKVDSSKLESLEEYLTRFDISPQILKSDIVSYLKGLNHVEQ